VQACDPFSDWQEAKVELDRAVSIDVTNSKMRFGKAGAITIDSVICVHRTFSLELVRKKYLKNSLRVHLTAISGLPFGHVCL